MESARVNFLGFSGETEQMTDSTKQASLPEKVVPVTKRFTFTEDWCAAFLLLTGDRNLRLHSKEGLGVVQGVAVIAQIGTMLSEIMPEYEPVDFAGRFSNPVYIGETIALTFNRLDSQRAFTQAEVTVRVEGREGGSTCKVILVSERVWRKGLR